jgi:putative zinc finger/helix-turn-helix YgiT family protein
MSKAVREQLIQINLEKIKEAVKNNRAVFIERQENRKTLYNYSLTTQDIMKGVCPYCEDFREIEIIRKMEKSMIRGREIASEAEFSLCTACGKEFASMQQMDTTLTNGYNLYRELENIIFPAKIIAIRQKYGASQKAFAKILDLGELTINSFEQGSLPSKSVSNLMRLMEKPGNFTELFEKNRSKLSSFQVKKIESKLSEQSVPLYSIDLDSMIEVKEKYTGYNRPDWEKYIALLQLILNAAGKKLYKMALLKIAFYADFASFKHNVRSLTGWPYVAIDHGPVPEEWKTILHHAEETENLVSEPDESEMGDLFYLPADFAYQKASSCFSDDELELIKDVTDKLKDKSATELRDMTHKEDAWLKTYHAEKIEYRHAESLKLF